MDPENNEQSEQRRGSEFFKKSKEKFQKTKEKAEKTKKIIKFLRSIPKFVYIFLIGIILFVVVIVLFGGFLSIIDNWNWNTTKTAKQEVFGATSNYSASVVTLNKSNGTWEISVNDELKNKLTEAGIDTAGMSQDELLKQLLMLYGVSDQDFSDEELELMPTLLKAEIATQYVDLRTRDEMYDSSTNEYKILTDSEIKTAKENNQILGTIHLKRVNTSDLDNSIILEYIDYNTFEQIVKKENPTVDDYNSIKGYFSINDDGNLVIATWNYNKITYTSMDGKIKNPYNSSEFQASENYVLSEMVIDYKPLVNKYTLPFEVLTALLINSEDAEFVEKVANLAFSANIEITIIEESTQSNIDYLTNYYETIRNYQYISLYSTTNGTRRIETDYEFLSGENDEDTDNESDIISWNSEIIDIPVNIKDCTYKIKKFDDQESYSINQNVELKQNSYKYGITLADTWFIKAQKGISAQKNSENIDSSGSYEGDYTYSEAIETTKNEIPVSLETKYLDEYMVQKNSEIVEKANNRGTAQEPSISVNSDTISCVHSYKILELKINGTNYTGDIIGDKFGFIEGYKPSDAKNIEIKDENGNSFAYTYNSNNKQYERQKINLNVAVDYNQKTIIYKKIDTKTSETGTKEKYELVEETPTQNLYDDKSEKFLKAYDESSKAKGNMSSTPGWLEDLLDEYDPNYSTIIMYLLDSYYGRDTEGYDINSVLNVYELDSFKQFSGTSGANAGFNQFKNFLRSLEGHEGLSSDGTQYKVGIVAGDRTVGYGIDLETSGKEDEIKALTGMTEIKEGDFIPVEIIDKIEEECINEAIEAVKNKTNGLDLKEYQIYALALRVYNCGANGAFMTRNGKTFKEAYNAYWKESDDEYGVTPNNNMYNHSLYTQYMKEPQTSDGEYLKGLENRRKSEWILFKTGYFDTLGEYYIEANRYSIEGINLYNTDGSVNTTEISKLNQELTRQVSTRSGKYMNNNGLQYKQCTWWAYSRASEYLGKAYPKRTNGTSGNGGEWYDINKQNGWFEYGNEPRANSIICWWNKSSPNYGHVAYVEAVDTINNKIYISHASGGTAWKGITTIPLNGYFDGAYPNGYIYLDSPKNFK